jgi:hypothetical protein
MRPTNGIKHGYKLIDEESTREMGLRRELLAHGRWFRPARSKCAKNLPIRVFTEIRQHIFHFRTFLILYGTSKTFAEFYGIQCCGDLRNSVLRKSTEFRVAEIYRIPYSSVEFRWIFQNLVFETLNFSKIHEIVGFLIFEKCLKYHFQGINWVI